jgi:hypothetical protein
MATNSTKRPDAKRTAGSLHRDCSAPSLYVEARVYNEGGLYRVLTIGDEGHRHNNHDCAAILRKLADWVEKQKAQNDRTERQPPRRDNARNARPPERVAEARDPRTAKRGGCSLQ